MNESISVRHRLRDIGFSPPRGTQRFLNLAVLDDTIVAADPAGRPVGIVLDLIARIPEGYIGVIDIDDGLLARGLVPVSRQTTIFGSAEPVPLSVWVTPSATEDRMLPARTIIARLLIADDPYLACMFVEDDNLAFELDLGIDRPTYFPKTDFGTAAENARRP
jgi:hypothetical protein